MLQRSLPSVLLLVLSCGASDHTTKEGSGGHAGSSAGATSGGGGRGGRNGTAGATGKAGAGTSARGGGSATGGRAGAAGSAGTGGQAATGGGGAAASGGTAAGEGGTGADVGEAGMGTSHGGAGEGGAGNPASNDVHGKIIDFWGHPVPNAPVAIGGVRVVTGSNGAFVIPDVAAKYDVSFIIRWDNPDAVYGWVYQGLTRRDPTLQVFKAFNDRNVSIEVHPLANSAPFTGDYRWLLGFGSENGKANHTSDANGIFAQPSWQGPASNDWTLHTLYMIRSGGIPTSYRAYTTAAIPVTDGDADQRPADIDLTEQTLTTGNVSGSIHFNTGESAENSVFVRFTSGAHLALVNAVATGTGTPDFSYLVPILPNGSITVATSETPNDGSYSVVHRDGLAPGATDIGLTVPVPMLPTAPTDNAIGIDESVIFRFNGGDPDAHARLIHIEDEDFYDGIYVVTAKTGFALGDLPIVNGEFQLRSNQTYRWWVETHGQPASVDDMAAPGGFIDDFGLDLYRPAGAVRGSGSVTVSKQFHFETLAIIP